MTLPTLPAKNVVPTRYRGVSVARIETDLDDDSLRAHFLGREVYRRTRFVVARSGERLAVLAIDKESDGPLFSRVTEVRVLAGPDETAFVHAPEADTAIPSRLAQAALEQAPGKRAVVVQGRYEHVSFILDPDPLRIVVREVVPPGPPKLVDQLDRVIGMLDSLHPVLLVPDVVDLTAEALEHPAAHYLLPCRGSGGDVAGAQVSYLDERPPHDPDWFMLGCDRSLMIHEWFYGSAPKQRYDFCPKKRGPVEGPLLTKCCLQEFAVESGSTWASVPWGSSLDHVREALVELVARLEPGWAPV